jgi:eukaryotic-like serine/threonine-protein kinase
VAPVILKSKYEILNLVSENIISFYYSGKTHYSSIPVQIVKYKEDYLNSGLVRGLIQKCEQLMLVKDPTILMLIDYYYDGKNFYAIYESPQKHITLEAFLKSPSHWNVKILWGISSQILSGLMKLEYEGLVYGNLNLSSILVSPNYKVKLTKIALPIQVMKSHWNDFQLIEDCIFYPPEFLKDQTYTTSSDVYSFGVLLYFLLSKSWPYQYVLKIDALKKELTKEAKPFKKIDTRLPDRLIGVVEQCLQHDPNARFLSFVDLIKTYKGKKEFDPISTTNSKRIRRELENDIEAEQQKRKKSRLKKIMTVAGIISVALLLYGIYYSYLTAIPEREVPDVIGLSRYEADELLEGKKLKSIIAGARIHTSYEEGIVIETKPPAGRMVKQNRMVRLFISKGTGPSLVPDLVGLSRDKVQALLEENGFNVRVIKELYSIQYLEGVVISQFPTPSTFSAPGDEIEIIISKGFPVELTVNKPKVSLFKNKDNLRSIELSFFILDEWASQNVDVFFHYDGKHEKIYSDLHQAGEAKIIEFELEYGGRIEVFFNDEKGFSKTIQD